MRKPTYQQIVSELTSKGSYVLVGPFLLDDTTSKVHSPGLEFRTLAIYGEPGLIKEAFKLLKEGKDGLSFVPRRCSKELKNFCLQSVFSALKTMSFQEKTEKHKADALLMRQVVDFINSKSMNEKQEISRNNQSYMIPEKERKARTTSTFSSSQYSQSPFATSSQSQYSQSPFSASPQASGNMSLTFVLQNGNTVKASIIRTENNKLVGVTPGYNGTFTINIDSASVEGFGAIRFV